VDARAAPIGEPQTRSLNMCRNIKLALLAALSLSACAHSPPPIGRGGPRFAADIAPWFDARVKQGFPAGSDDEKLRAELHRQAFKITRALDPATRYPFTATYQAHEIACIESWTIRWSSERGKITDISATWNQTCL
jgi:hypothetical protein